MTKAFNHIPVLFHELIDNLHIKSDGIYVDGTLGGGGHARGVCKRLSSSGRFIGIDRDEDAIRAAGKILSQYNDKASIVHDTYSNMSNILEALGISSVDGIYLDLGISSYQIDDEDRGFSYMHDGPLDMRMDQSAIKNAEIVVNDYPEGELKRIIKEYGEERYAGRIASAIATYRITNHIKTTRELSEIIKKAIPAKMVEKGSHPAKRTFQAIRIEVNDELSQIENSIDMMIDLLNPCGRLIIITFHSLEDRIVKNKFRENENPCTCPPNLPVCICGKKSKGKVITRKPIIPSKEEIDINPRAASSKLRIFEKIKE